jgi:gamma-glutamyltranspeptidase/glutathione hydrolase
MMPVSGRNGMVSSAHPMATDAGLSILRAGGNAFDAAVAIAATLNVVEPMMSGIGGYGTVLVYDSHRGECRFLNCSDRMPRGLDSDLFRPPTKGWQENRRGAKAVSTPGNVRGWQALSRSYGRLSWSQLFQPAIGLAQDGVPVTPALAQAIEREFADFPQHARKIYGRGGKPLGTGDSLVQSDLARSLIELASVGPDAL